MPLVESCPLADYQIYYSPRADYVPRVLDVPYVPCQYRGAGLLACPSTVISFSNSGKAPWNASAVNKPSMEESNQQELWNHFADGSSFTILISMAPKSSPAENGWDLEGDMLPTC